MNISFFIAISQKLNYNSKLCSQMTDIKQYLKRKISIARHLLSSHRYQMLTAKPKGAPSTY